MFDQMFLEDVAPSCNLARPMRTPTSNRPRTFAGGMNCKTRFTKAATCCEVNGSDEVASWWSSCSDLELLGR